MGSCRGQAVASRLTLPCAVAANTVGPIGGLCEDNLGIGKLAGTLVKSTQRTQSPRPSSSDLVHVFNAFLRTACETKEENVAEHVAAIQTYVKTYEQLSPQEAFAKLATEVKHFKVRKAYKKVHKKVESAFTPPSAAESIFVSHLVPILRKDPNYRAMVGIAPRGNLERMLQSFLETGAVPDLQDFPLEEDM